MRTRILLAVLVAITAVAGLTAGSAVANHGWSCYYCGPAWFTSGEGHDSWYDCYGNFWWRENWMWKSDTALGKVVWIDLPGNWRAAVESYEINMIYGVDPYNWQMKLYGKNTSSVGYSAELRGDGYTGGNCV